MARMVAVFLFFLCPIIALAENEQGQKAGAPSVARTGGPGKASTTNASGFYDGRLFLEIRAGAPVGFGGNIHRDLTEEFGVFASGVRLRGVSGEFLLEYAVLDWLSLGFSIHHEKYRVTGRPNVAPMLVGLAFIPRVTAMFPEFAGNFNQYVQYAPFLIAALSAIEIEIDPFMRITTLDFNVGFHFLDRSAFDPYFRVMVGVGQEMEGKNPATRIGVALGLRFFFGDSFYVLLELGGSTYNVMMKNSGSDYTRYVNVLESAGGMVSGNLHEASALAGAGYAF